MGEKPNNVLDLQRKIIIMEKKKKKEYYLAYATARLRHLHKLSLSNCLQLHYEAFDIDANAGSLCLQGRCHQQRIRIALPT